MATVLELARVARNSKTKNCRVPLGEAALHSASA